MDFNRDIFKHEEGRPDPLLFFLLVLLAGAGLFILAGVSSSTSQVLRYFKQQAFSFALGAVLFVIAVEFPLKKLRSLSWPIILSAVFAMALVFIPGLGQARSQSSHIPRWIGIDLPGLGSMTFQPVEWAKIAIILFLAGRLADREDRSLRGYIGPLVPVAVLVLLTVLQPNFGSAVLLVLITAILVFISGIKLRSLLSVIFVLTPLLFLLLILRPYRNDRILVWLDPYKYPGKAFQILEAFRAFHEGGWTGSVIGQGRAHRVLPDRHNDFVFAIVAHDYGYLGLVLLAILYAGIYLRGMSILRSIESSYARLIGFGILGLFIIQAILNMAVVTGLVPTTGISLPFISLGGSNLIMMMLAAGLLLNVTSLEKIRSQGRR